MGLINKKVTDREKAAIYLHVFGGVNDWGLLYAIADKTTDGELTQSAMDNKYPSKWKNTDKIKNLIQTVSREKYALLEAEKNKAFEEGRRSVLDNVQSNVPQSGTSPKLVDYTNPENQNRKLNELVNTSDDAGEVLDALKVIIQTQKADRDAAKTGKVVNAYVPMCCADCTLYQKAKKG